MKMTTFVQGCYNISPSGHNVAGGGGHYALIINGEPDSGLIRAFAG